MMKGSNIKNIRDMDTVSRILENAADGSDFYLLIGDFLDTVSRVLENAADGSDFYLLIGDFLDEFYRSGQSVKQQMIETPPSGDALRNPQEHLSFAAATAHKLANDYGLDVPEWVFEKRYYMTGAPFFACHARGNLRLLFMYKSPAEFKHRNLFVDENVLSRV